MKKNIWALGNRSISGNLDNIFAAGDLKIVDANIKKVRLAGNMNVNNSYINLVRVAGNVKTVNSNFGDFKAVGKTDIIGACKAETFVATGKLKADYLECTVLRNCAKGAENSLRNHSQIVEFIGSFKAKTFESLCPFRISCDFQFDNIISTSYLQYRDMLECERFYSFGEVDAEGINGEFVYINPSEKTAIRTIVGSQIIISNNFKADKEFNAIPMSLSPRFYKKLKNCETSIMSVAEIEGDKIDIEYVRAEQVSGIDVVIGDLCIIEKLEYKNSVKISEKAIVNEIVQL